MLPEWIRYSRSAWKFNLDKKETIDLRAISNRACNERSVASIVAIVFGTIACVACHLYYAIANCVYRFVRDIWYIDN